MRFFFRLWVVNMVLCLFGSELIADYLAKTFDGEDHPFLDDVRMTIEDSDGFVWIGCNDGLLFYDGESFEVVDIDHGNTVMSLVLGPDGRIWVGAVSQIGYVERMVDGSFSYTSLIDRIVNSPAIPSNVWNLHVLGESVFWVGDTHVFVWDGTDVTVWPMPNSYRLLSYVIDGELWVHQRKVGLNRWDGSKFVLEYPDDDLIREGIIEVMLTDGKLQFYTFSGNVLSLGGNGFELDYSLGVTVFDVKPWRDGYLVVGVDSLFFQDGESLERIYHVEPGAGHMWSARIAGRFVWASFSNGLIRIDTDTRFHGIGLVASIFPWADGQTLISAQSGGFRYEDGNVEKICEGFLVGMAPVGDTYVVNRLWEVELLGSNSKIELPNIARIIQLLPLSEFPGIYLGYGVSGMQLFRITDKIEKLGRFVEVDWQNPASFVRVNEKTFYFGSTKDGLWRGTLTSDNPDSAEDIDLVIVSPYNFGQEELLWARPFMFGDRLAVLCNRGLYFYDPNRQSFYRTNALDEDFFHPNPYTIHAAVESESVAWVLFSDSEGFYWFRRLELIGTGFRKTDYALPQAEAADPIRFVTYDRERELFLIAGNGMIEYKSPQVFDTPTTLPPRLVSVEASSELLPLDNIVTMFPAQHIAVNHPTSTAVDRPVTYRWRIAGQDWSEFTSEPASNLFSLWPGEYVLELQARDDSSNLSEVSAYAITILAPWYLKWYTLTGAGLIGIGGFVGLVFLVGIPRRLENARLKETIEQDDRNFERASESGNRMLRALKHEVGEPINAARATVYLIDEIVKPDPVAQMHCAKVQDLLDTTMQLVSGMIQFPRIVDGKMVLRDVDFNAYYLALDLMKVYEPKAEKQNVVFEIPWKAEQLPVSDFRGDRDKIFQVVSNLISNAIRHASLMDNLGLVRVYFSSEKLAADKARLRIAVHDNGGGVPDHLKLKIFDDYFSTSEDKKNLGLGLYLSQMLVTGMGGRLEIKDNTPAGAIFYFELILKVPDKIGSTSTSNTQKHQ
ncbi:MAG: ATP-binding protein [Verrucomicrobiota bacterium]